MSPEHRAEPIAAGTDARPPARLRIRAFAALAAVVLALAVGIQVLAALVDWAWLTSPILNSALVGVLLVIAVQLPPLRGRYADWLLSTVAVLVPAVDKLRAHYERREAERQRRVEHGRINSTRMANMQHVAAFNSLHPIPAELVTALGTTTERPVPVEEMVERVAEVVFATTAWSAPAPPETQRRVLDVLYRDATPGIEGHLWRQQVDDDLVEPLADVLIDTAHVRRTCAARREVIEELRALQLEFTTAALLDRLSLVPTDAVGRMQRVVRAYSILERAGVEWTDDDWDAIQKAAIVRGGDQIECCARICAERLAATSAPVSAELLVLIYHEHSSRSTEGYWRSLRESGAFVADLARLLLDAGMLPDFVSTELREPATVARLLAAHRAFNLPDIRAELVALDRLRLLLADFAQELWDQGFRIPEGSLGTRVVDGIEHDVRGGLPRGAAGIERIAQADAEIALLLGFGIDAVAGDRAGVDAATWSPALGRVPLPEGADVPESLVGALGLVALHLHLAEQELATSEARVALARTARSRDVDEAALVLAAHRLEVDRASGEPVALRDVAARWARILDEARAADRAQLDERIADARRRLVTVARAPRPASTPATAGAAEREVARVLVTIGETLAGLEHVLHEHDRADGEVADRLGTVTRRAAELEHELIEHTPPESEWLVRPYLITYDKDAGPLAELIDSLAAPDAAQRAVLAAIGIRLHVGDQAKYRFANFTRQARLGFLPREMPFDEFLAEFEHDLRIVLDKRERVLGYEVVRPRTTSTLTVDGRRPLTVAALPKHGSCVLDPHGGRIDYTPFPDDYRGPDAVVVDDADHRRHVVRLAVRPDLRRIEVTLSRIHLSQFAELVLDDGQSPSWRRPSIENVVATLRRRGQLDPIEERVVARHLHQIVGA